MVEVSVCIPVYGTEDLLEKCLFSLSDQTFRDFEVLLVNDGSPGGSKSKKILKKWGKSSGIPYEYLEHGRNRGILETRRTAVEAASGKYIFTLDSDDCLPPQSMEILYREAVKTGADIVHGEGEARYALEEEKSSTPDEKQQKRFDKIDRGIKNVYPGILEERDVFRGYLVDKNHCGFLWGKLIKRDIYLQALDILPSTYCTMGDDFAQYFWISFFSRKYAGIKKVVYYYSIDSGISSDKIIDSEKRWEQVCSTASVFTAIYYGLEEKGIVLKEDERRKLFLFSCNYVVNNLIQLETVVVPELKEKALDMLYDFWGRDMVEMVQQHRGTAE